MARQVTIHATLTTADYVRVWICFNYQIYQQLVNLEDHFKDVELPYGFNAHDHHEVVDFIRTRWRQGPSDFLILAYQCLKISTLTDDRSAYGHPNTTTTRVNTLLTNKVFVYTDRFVASEMTLADLALDAGLIRQWIRETDRPPTPKSVPEMQTRRLITQTVKAYDTLALAYDPTLRLRKIGPATYIPLVHNVEYKPVLGLNPEPKY